MLRGLVLFVLCGSCAASAPVVADVHAVRNAPAVKVDTTTVRFVYQPYREGESFVMATSSRIESKYRYEGVGELETVARHGNSKQVHVVSMNEDRVATANVHFDRWEDFLAVPDNEIALGPSLAGKSFTVLVRSPGRPEIRDLDGDDLRDMREVDEVMAHVGELDAPALYDTIDVRVGESVPSVAEGIGRRVAATLDNWSHHASGATATFRKLEGDIGYFDVQMTMSSETFRENMNYRVELAGELRISKKTGRMVHWELKGPIVDRGGGFSAVMTGDER